MRDRQLAEQGAVIKEQGATIQEQGAVIKEQENMLRSTIKLLLNAGMKPDEIASHLGVAPAIVSRLM